MLCTINLLGLGILRNKSKLESKRGDIDSLGFAGYIKIDLEYIKESHQRMKLSIFQKCIRVWVFPKKYLFVSALVFNSPHEFGSSHLQRATRHHKHVLPSHNLGLYPNLHSESSINPWIYLDQRISLRLSTHTVTSIRILFWDAYPCSCTSRTTAFGLQPLYLTLNY